MIVFNLLRTDLPMSNDAKPIEYQINHSGFVTQLSVAMSKKIWVLLQHPVCLPYLIPCYATTFNLLYVAFEIIEIKMVHDFNVKRARKRM